MDIFRWTQNPKEKGKSADVNLTGNANFEPEIT